MNLLAMSHLTALNEMEKFLYLAPDHTQHLIRCLFWCMV